MKPEFWHAIWTERKIGFHRSDSHPMLCRHWPALRRDGMDVLVPLSGKTLDMRWLAGEGHRVTGVELDQRAVDEFFAEWGHEPAKYERADGLTDYRAGAVELVVGDFFELQPATPWHAFYDRAALIALPESMRQRYLQRLAELLAPGAEGILITFEYPSSEMEGPPFPVRRPELDAQDWLQVDQLERQQVIDHYTGLREAGVTSLVETAYRLVRTDQPA
ncbi:thiopurine S-methyltransferase [Salicola sp. Rm-C-2C1-2]|uniref:thiopurine S-methyltransferase n=1 Tax=Salicola sp. Rm-C-2C1-2 TaxID=3141321 RepID=UPI0032E3A76C